MYSHRSRSWSPTENPHSAASYGLLAINQKRETSETNSTLRASVCVGESSHPGRFRSQGLKEK